MNKQLHRIRNSEQTNIIPNYLISNQNTMVQFYNPLSLSKKIDNNLSKSIYYFLKSSVLALIFFLLSNSYVNGQVTTYNTAGDHTYTVPAGVSRINVQVLGGGGGGGGQNGANSGGGGGGGGGYATAIVPVTPGQMITVTVGSGGTGGSNVPTNGTVGTVSLFPKVGTILTANGGAGGIAANGNNTFGTGGSGGTGVGGTTNTPGVNGAPGTTSTSGAGGAGAPPLGGVGGAARNTSGTGNAGVIPGGGGSGGLRSGGATDFGGGAGATGSIIIEPAPEEIQSAMCSCNNNQTPNMTNGTFATTLIIKNRDNTPLAMGQIYTVVASGTTGVSNTGGGPLGTPTFTFCNGVGCPTGVTSGQYYLNVWVQNSGAYNVNVDGPDLGGVADFTLTANCAVTYPALPIIPAGLSPNAVCIETVATFPSNGGRYSFTNNYDAPSYLNGFSQAVAGDPLSIDINNILGDQVFPQTIYLINQNAAGCKTASSAPVSVFREPVLMLQGGLFNCEDNSVPFNLNRLITATSISTGTYRVNGIIQPGSTLTIPVGGFCGTFTYEFTDPNCGFKTQTVAFQVTTTPKPVFDITSGITSGEVRCLSTGDITVGATRTSTGLNPVYKVSRNNVEIDVNWSGSGLVVPAPAANVSNTYKICLTETNANPPSVCPGITLPPGFTPCSVTVCKTFTVYNDGNACGANNLFPDQCVARAVNVCDAQASPRFSIGCSFFNITVPLDFATTELTPQSAVIDCSTPSVLFDYNADVLSLTSVTAGGGTEPPKTIRELSAATRVICSVVCLKIDLGLFSIRPFGAICDFLGCDKTIAQVILGVISNLVQSDGGGVLLVADTDGDGAFDFTAINETDNEGTKRGTISIPNNVKGKGKITARLVNGWPLYPNGVCGNVNPSGSDLLAILPFGLIPIAGPIITQILASASCNANLAWSSFADASVTVLNTGKPTLVNCNTNGYAFEASGACNVGVNWSIPVAFSSCDNLPIPFNGYLTTTDTSFYDGPAITQIGNIIGQGIYQVSGPVPGSKLPVGTYTVTYRVVGCNGNPTDCTFPVVITDTPPPLVCPNNMTFFTDVDQCTAVVNGLAPLRGLGGCTSILNYSYTTPVTGVLVETTSMVPGVINVPDGVRFELGTTNITYTLSTAGFPDQTCTFSITVEDRQTPKAVCRNIVVKLDVNGMATVASADVDGGSSDNCAIQSIQISRGGPFGETVAFDCGDIGNQNITLRITDASGNFSECIATAQVQNFFEGYQLALDIPEFCLEPFQNMIDFSQYVKIIAPDGTVIAHSDIQTAIGATVTGTFGISVFVPDNPMGSLNPGSITPDGKYTIGDGTGWITVSYILSIDGQVSQIGGGPITGCFKIASDFVRIEKLFPDWKGGYLCCDQTPILLGHASWDPDQDGVVNGTIKGTLPAGSPALGYLTLTDVLGTYPKTVYGRWTGNGVAFADPDGIPFNGDEYYFFDPTGLDGSYTLTYTVGDEPCQYVYSQEMLVTCRDLQVALSDITVCPANWVPERVVLIDLNEPNDSVTVVVSITGLGALGVDGAHIGTMDPNEPCDDLVDKNLPTGTQVGACAPDMEVLQVVDGRVVIPGFWAPAVRNKTYPITVRTYQVLNNPALPEYQFGCEDMFTYNITVVDTIAPTILNCPKEPIIVDAIVGQCEAFVNFEYPIAYDTCMGYTKVVQVDTTGLKSGSLFPVGLTVLSYTTIDTVGNQNYCELKIVVQDFRLAPRIQCPATTAFTAMTDVDKCGATVGGLKPVSITDNCLPHVAVTYEVTGPNGEQVACGFENASGTFFPIGTSTVKYKVQDQPLVKITEVIQEDGRYGVEITNFGPAALDITCGKFMLKDAAGVVIETFTVPTDNNISTMFQRPIFPAVNPVLWNVRTPNNILDVGETFTHVFNGDQNGDGILDVTNSYNRCDVRKYCFGFLDYVIDEAVVNDQVKGEILLRSTICDTDKQTDFRVGNPCDTMSFGKLNPGLKTMTFSNDTVGLQKLAPNMDMCSFTVTVTDVEAPTCIWHDSIRVANTAPIALLANLCLRDSITMPAGLVDDINIFNLNITTPNAGAITAYLKSPLGKRIQLFRRVCGTDTIYCAAPVGISGNPNINVNLDENINKTTVAPSVTTAGCSPLGQGLTFRPMESFNAFYGTQGGGKWVLEVFGEEGTLGTLNSWDLQILYQKPFGQKDTTIVNSPGLCDSVFTWTHPMLEDNCMKGSIQLQYLFSNTVTGVSDTVTSTLKNLMNTVNTSGCRETRRFRVGTTEVRYTLTDQYGNVNVCSFKVIIKDNEKPVFVAGTCNDKQIFLRPGQCTGILLNPPMATDNCGLDTITYCFAKADGTDSVRADINLLPIGDYIIIAKAIDIYGNVQRCSFRVVVIEFIPEQRDLACNGEVNITLDATCTATIDQSFFLADENNVRCYDNYDIIVTDEDGKPHSLTFTLLDEGKRFKVSIIDNKPPRMLPFNSCWGYLNVEKKLGPTFLCPRDTVVACNIDVNAKNNAGKYLLGEPVITSCEKTTSVWYQDEWTSFGQCDSLRAQVVRTWFLENEKGQRTQCVQRITILKMQLRDVVFPVDVLNIDCKKVATNPISILPDSTGFPTLFGFNVNRVGGLCMVSYLYTDEKFEICNGSYEILRTWKLRDMCGAVSATNPRTHVQVIKVTDNQGPIIVGCPKDTVISVLAWGCDYEGAIPVPSSITDVCSPTFKFSPRIIGGGRISGKINANGTLSASVTGLRKGTYTIIYDFKDECLNKSTCSYKITIVDKIAPVATAKEFVTVSLTKSDLPGTFGIATLTPKNIDNGSYDNCGPVYMEVRREDGAPSCSNEGDFYDHDNSASTPMIRWNNNVTYNGTVNGKDQINPLHTFDRVFDTDKGQHVKFCCEDIGKTIKVWLRVWDDADMDGVFGSTGDNFSESWGNVKVEDKTVPTLTCKDVETTCDRALLQTSIGVWKAVDAKDSIDILPTISGICPGTFALEYRDSGTLSVCNTGTITRTYRIIGTSVTCTSEISIYGNEIAPSLEVPIALHTWNKCTLTEADVLENTVRAALFNGKTIIRDDISIYYYEGEGEGTVDCEVATGWGIHPNTTNGLTPSGVSAYLGKELQGKSKFNSNFKNVGCYVFGRNIKIEEYKVGEGCRKWLVTWTYINWCDNSDAGCRKTLYKYEDTTPPVITVCPTVDLEVSNATCKVAVTLNPVATDTGGCEAGYFWRVRVSKGGVFLGEAQFNNRTLAPTLNLNTISFTGVPNSSISNGFEAGIYDVTYIVTDGCGNVGECKGLVNVWAKAPTPYCVNISSAVMKNGQVELWAKDFDKGSFANCNNGPLLFTFDNMNPVLKKIDVIHYFKGAGLDATQAEYNAGLAQQWRPVDKSSGRLFGCKVGDGSTFPASDVRMTVWDNNLRSDFCMVRLTLLDNQGACGGNTRIDIAGEINALTGDKMTSVVVKLDANLPEFPLSTLSDKDGKYKFSNQPIGADFLVSAKKDGDYLNGVNTLDLLKIQKHILGLVKLESGYQMIAADVDNDKAIRVSDLVELRKLILGVNEKLPYNSSWRFVDARQSMGETPWPFNEVMSHGELKTNIDGDKFMGVKIGDVDGGAQANLRTTATDLRSVGVKFVIEDREVKQGETFEVAVLANEFSKVYGFQFSANLNGLMLLNAEGRGIDLDDNNVAIHSVNNQIASNGNDPYLMAMSWTNTKGISVAKESNVMTLTFKATQNGLLSKMINLSSVSPVNSMRSEAYVGEELDTKAINIEFRNAKMGSYALLQNEPNPWKTETTIKYDLPSAGPVKMSIIDITGKTVWTQSTIGKLGSNVLTLSSSQLKGATGLLIYKIESGDFTAQKKMIVID